MAKKNYDKRIKDRWTKSVKKQKEKRVTTCITYHKPLHIGVVCLIGKEYIL